MEDVQQIRQVQKILARLNNTSQDQKQQQQKKKACHPAGKNFKALAITAEQAHQILSGNNAPYRFCIYNKNGDVFIEVIILDGNVRILESYTKNITHDEYETWLKFIQEESGLIVNQLI